MGRLLRLVQAAFLRALQVAFYWAQGVFYWAQNILFIVCLAALYLLMVIPSALYVLWREHESIKVVGWDTFILWLLCAPIQVAFNFALWSDPPSRPT